MDNRNRTRRALAAGAVVLGLVAGSYGVAAAASGNGSSSSDGTTTQSAPRAPDPQNPWGGQRSDETPLTGDFTGDGRDDAVTLTGAPLYDAYVAPSTGSAFGAGVKWHDRLVAGSERMVAITQGRSYPIREIRPGRLARLLERYVTRPGYGIGLGSAETMELAIREVGAPRILLAAAASALTKPFGVHGVFYRVAGPQAKAIDGPRYLRNTGISSDAKNEPKSMIQ